MLSVFGAVFLVAGIDFGSWSESIVVRGRWPQYSACRQEAEVRAGRAPPLSLSPGLQTGIVLSLFRRGLCTTVSLELCLDSMFSLLFGATVSGSTAEGR